jgi:hypothetical protein
MPTEVNDPHTTWFTSNIKAIDPRFDNIAIRSSIWIASSSYQLLCSMLVNIECATFLSSNERNAEVFRQALSRSHIDLAGKISVNRGDRLVIQYACVGRATIKPHH